MSDKKSNQKRWYGVTKKKRMFSIDVVDTDRFLEMPHSTRELWWQLNMRADDDGFVSDIKKILKITNTTFDDITILIAKGYLISFVQNSVQNAQNRNVFVQDLHKNAQICTSFVQNSVQNAQKMHKNDLFLIVHWNLCNSIRKDTYTPSEHKKLLQNIVISENGTYEVYSKQADLFSNSDFVHRNDIVPQISIDKISKDKNMCANLCKDQFEQFWSKYPKKRNKQRTWQEWEKANITEDVFQEIIKHIEERVKTTWVKDNKKYVVYPERFIKYQSWKDDISDYEPYQENIEDTGILDLSKKQHV